MGEDQVEVVRLRGEAEIEARRARVLSLRLRQQSLTAIAAIIGTSLSTVSRDWAAIQTGWSSEYGQSPKVDKAALIGESVAIFRDIELAALMEATRAKSTFDKTLALKEARSARQSYIDLIMDCGLLERSVGTVTITHARAEEIRARLRLVGTVTPQMLVSEAERDWVDLPVIDVPALPAPDAPETS
jgi:hypothetical protein